MKVRDTLSLSTRMFRNRPMRTFLTVLGVSVGIGMVLFLVSFGYGLQKTILNRITTADALLSLDVNPSPSNLVDLNNNSIADIVKIPGVTEVSRLAEFPGQIGNASSTADATIYGMDNSYFRLNGSKVASGNYPSSDSAYEIIISSAVSRLFNFTGDEALGQEIELTLYISESADPNSANSVEETQLIKQNNRYKIVGIMEDDNSSFVYAPLKTLDNVTIDKYSALKIKAIDSKSLDTIRPQLVERGFLVSSLSDTIAQANKIFGIIQIFLFFFGFVALIVSAIGMFNTMTITLLERTNEIGIMRSIGISGKDIRRIFLVESGLMGLFGGIGGVVVGYVAGQLVNFFINILARNFGGVSINLFYSPWQFTLIVVGFSVVVGFLTGIYPSVRASRLNPLDALRYK